MKRMLARVGLLALLAGTPLALRLLVGAAAIPSFKGSDGLSGSYVPLDAVLTLVGLLSWALWAYLALSILLHSLAILTASVNAPGQRMLFAASTILAPKVVRALVELAIGGALVTASVTVPASSAIPAAGQHALAHAGPIHHTGTVIANTAVSEPKRDTYRVRPGDSLWRIAERKLGSGFRWREIYRLNEGRRFSDSGTLTHPHLIRPGWVLDLPGDRTTQLQDDGVENEPSPGRTPVTPISPSPTATPSPIPSSESTAEPTQQGADREAETDDPETPATTAPVLKLPSGLLVAASFASGLLTAHLLGRLHRRRSRRLSGVSSVEPVDIPDLIHDLRRSGASEMAGPIDVAINAVIEAWHTQAGTWPRVLGAVETPRHVSVCVRASEGAPPAASGGTISPSLRFARVGSMVVAEVDGPFPVQLREPRTPLERGLLVPLGRVPDGSVVHVSTIGLGQLSITGPEAAGLVRQLVVAAATQGGTDDLELVLVGSSEEMQALSRLPQASSCVRWEEADEALQGFELEFVRRARLFLQEGAQGIEEHLADHADERLPAILMVCERPPAALAGRIDALAQQAAAFGAGVVSLGWKLTVPALHARLGSPVEFESDLRIPKSLEPFLLDEPTRNEAIEIIRSAHPSESSDETSIEEPEEESPERSAPVRVATMPKTPPPIGSGRATPLPPPGDPPAPPSDRMAVRCLGPFEISRGDEALPTGWRAKGRELVAYLIANPAGVPKERAIDELWGGDVEPARASIQFNKSAARIRARARGMQDSRTYIERVGDGAYRLEEAAWWVDAWEFERLIQKAEDAEDSADAITGFRDAVALYRGEFCDDAYYPWLEPVRARFRSLFVEACGRLAYLLSSAGEHDQALAVLDRAIRADPVCEDLVRRAIAVEAALGRRAAALARYRKLEATLDAELDVEPDPETQDLVERLLAPREKTD
jgi:DNA-binding SARP family transcriptional activator